MLHLQSYDNPSYHVCWRHSYLFINREDRREDCRDDPKSYKWVHLGLAKRHRTEQIFLRGLTEGESPSYRVYSIISKKPKRPKGKGGFYSAAYLAPKGTVCISVLLL